MLIAPFTGRYWQEPRAQATPIPTPSHDYTQDIAAVDTRIEALQQDHHDHALELADLLPMIRTERASTAALVKLAGTVIQEDLLDDLLEPWLTWNDATDSQKRVTVSRYIKAVMISPNIHKRSKARLQLHNDCLAGWQYV